MNAVARASVGCFVGVLAAVTCARDLPPGKAKPLIERACTGCHEINIGEKQRMDRQRWKSLVEDMVDKGARLSEEEVEEVVEYLVQNFGPAKIDR